MEWISVNKEKPENLQEILMTYNDFVMEGLYFEEKFYHPEKCCCYSSGEQEGITHWMPLPKPPEEIKIEGNYNDDIQKLQETQVPPSLEDYIPVGTFALARILKKHAEILSKERMGEDEK